MVSTNLDASLKEVSAPLMLQLPSHSSDYTWVLSRYNISANFSSLDKLMRKVAKLPILDDVILHTHIITYIGRQSYTQSNCILQATLAAPLQYSDVTRGRWAYVGLHQVLFRARVERVIIFD